MKKQFELGALMEHLPTDIRDSVFHQAKEEGKDTDELFVERRGWSEKARTNQLDEGSRAAVKYVSTRTMDRDNEVVVPNGIKTKEFMKYAHVLWGHNYSLPPIGSDEWIKPDEFGLQAKTIYADTGEGTMANVIWHLVQQGHQKASSVGFVPLTWTEPGHNDFDRVLGKLQKEWPELEKTGESLKRIITKAILLEHSDVSVPANADSEVIEVAKNYGANDVILKSLGFSGESNIDEWPDQKPYPNEHSARINSPDKYEKLRRQNDKFGTGIHAIFGILKDGKTEVQAIRFNKTKFTAVQAKKWLKDNDYKPIEFEAASGKQRIELTDKETFNCECIECGHKMQSEQHCKDFKCPKCGGTMRRQERPGPGQPINEEALRNSIRQELREMFPMTSEFKKERTIRVVNPHIKEVEIGRQPLADITKQAIDDAFDKMRGKV